MADLVWVTEAKGWLNQKEVPGPGFNPWIKNLWLSLPGGPWYWKHYGEDDSKLPWCGAGCAGVFKACGIPFPAKYASAREWLAWGTRLDTPAVGCVVVFERGPKSGHVGIALGRDQHGNLMVWGCNQSDGVTIAPFSEDRVLGYLWPPGYPAPALAILPRIASNGTLSRNEA